MKHARIHVRCTSDDSHDLHQVESASSSVAGHELAILFCQARVTSHNIIRSSLSKEVAENVQATCNVQTSLFRALPRLGSY